MWFQTAVMIFKNVIFLFNQSINGLIIVYEARKQPLSKTILDGCIIDTCWFRIVLFILSVFCIDLVFVYGQTNFVFGQIFCFLFRLSLESLYASYQVTLLVKIILVFVPSLIEDFSDKELRWLSRIASVTYASIASIIDTISEPKPFLMLGVLTGTNEPT